MTQADKIEALATLIQYGGYLCIVIVALFIAAAVYQQWRGSR